MLKNYFIYITSLLIVAIAIPLALQQSAQPQEIRQRAQSATGANIYVAPNGNDSGNGAQATPFKTIQKASTVATPGTTVHVAAGTYTGDFTTTKSGTANARIVYLSDTKWGAKLVGVSAEALWRNDGQYVDINGFDLKGSNTLGILMGGSNSRIINNNISGFSGDCMFTYPYSITNVDVIGNVMHGCGKGNLDHGIYVGHNGGTIANNIAYGNAGFGIHCWHNCNRMTISNNIMFDNGEGGMVIGQGDDPNNGSVNADNFIVSNNITLNNGGNGIQEYGATGSNNKFINNIVFNETLSVQTGTQTNTIKADPQFVNFQINGTGDYHLRPGSPGIDKGTPTGAPPTDIDGNPRPQGAGVDIGAYEAGSNVNPTQTLSPAPSIGPTLITPTIYCVGGAGVPPCAPISPSTPAAPTGGNGSITPGGTTPPVGGTNPTTVVPQPTTDPCQAGESSVFYEKKKTKTGGGFIEAFFRFFIQLIELLMKLIGMNPSPTPVPNPDPQPTGEPFPEPTTNPCPEPTTVQPSTMTQPTVTQGTSGSPTTASPASTGTRDPLKQPFASTSIWNMPIGSNAVYVPANLPNVPRGNQSAPMPQIDDEHIVLRPTAPMTTINYSDAGWSGKNRCNTTGSGGGLPISVPVPNDYLVPNDDTNSAAAFLMPDGRTIAQAQPFTRCTAGGPATSVIKFDNVDLYGDGIIGAHGGSYLSAIGGSIRVGELRPGGQPMRHAIKVNVDSPLVLYPCKTKSDCFRWPALTADGAAVGRYGTINPNPNPALKMGSLLAIPKATDINSLGLESEPGKMLAWTLQNYGAYIVDETGGAGFAISAEHGPDGIMRTQFKNDWGYDLEQRVNSNTVWSRDMQKLVKALAIVDNNSPTFIGGGGTPLQPLAPPIAPK